MKKIDLHIHPRATYGPEMDEYVRIMDDHDVAAALVHATATDLWGDRDAPSDDMVLAACQKHPGRLFGSMYLDLREAPERNIRKVERYAAAGFKSVKMFPNVGFDPGDEVHEPVWQCVEEHGLMCLSHCGWLAPNRTNPKMRIDSLTATPFHFEIPARRHPGIDFIFGHFGGGATYLETVVLCMRLKNCFGDSCPGWGTWVWRNRMPGLAELPFSQFVYGTDNCGEGYSDDEAWWTATLTDMGRSPEEIEQFFYGNAAKLLGLAESSEPTA